MEMPYKQELHLKSGLLLCAVLVFQLAVQASGPVGTAPDDGAQWTVLFANNSLEGWYQVTQPGRSPADEAERGQASFRIEDGEVIGEAVDRSLTSYLCSEKVYGDFEMTGEFFIGSPVDSKMRPMNSGIQIRSRWNEEAPSHRMTGLQVDLDVIPHCGRLFFEGHNTAPEATTGKEVRKRFSNFDKAARGNPDLTSPARRGEWNRFRIVARGPRILTFINGTAVEDYTNKAHYGVQPTGFIALQVHQITNPRPAEVRWRGLRIRELAPQPKCSRQ